MASNKKDSSGIDKKNWYNDRYESVSVQRNFAAVISLLALILSVISAFSISQIAPLKSVEPFVIEVDQKTGITQVVDPIKVKELTANESVNQYFIVQYARARESFLGSPDRNYFNYNLVRVLSTPQIFYAYQQEIALSNPNSPGMRLGSGGSREIHIESVKSLDKADKRGKAQEGDDSIRYLVKCRITEKTKGSPNDKTMQKLIFIEFKYADLDLTTEDRFSNPLGFQVTAYRVDDDSVTQ